MVVYYQLLEMFTESKRYDIIITGYIGKKVKGKGRGRRKEGREGRRKGKGERKGWEREREVKGEEKERKRESKTNVRSVRGGAGRAQRLQIQKGP